MDQLGLTSVGVIKLEGQRNWGLWKFQVIVLLKAQDVFGVVNGTEVKSETNSAEWTKKDIKAQSLLVTRLSESAMVHIITCETAFQMWSKLLSVYEQKSSTSIHLLQQRFFSYKYEEGTDISLFLSRLQEMKSQLKQAGEEISDKFIITKVLMSLPEKYSHFVSAWESVDPAKQNYDDLVARLLVEEERINSRSLVEDNNMALLVKTSERVQRKCFKCGKVGHYIQQCKSTRDTRKCFMCDKVGHLKADCHKLKNKSVNVKPSQNNNAFLVSAMTLGSEKDEQSFGQRWLIDSGASEHMTSEVSLLSNYLSVSDRFVIVGDGRRLPVLGVGIVHLNVYNGNSYVKSTLNEVLHVPDMKVNLFSIPKATKNGYKVIMSNEECHILKQGVVCGIGVRVGGHYLLQSVIKEDYAAVCSLSEWHERLCHQNLDYVRSILNQNNIAFSEDKKRCIDCLKGKAHRLPFKNSTSCSKKPLELVHGDLCGPMEVLSIGGARYFLLLKDDFTNYRVVYFLKNKSEVAEKIKNFILTAENSTSEGMKVLRTDNGTEFVNKEVKKLLDDKGIIHQTTVSYTPEQNGKAERDMRTLVEAARTMISAAKVEKELWAEAINMAVYVLNRTSPSRVKDKTPYQLWEKKNFDVGMLKMVFGSEVVVHIPKEKRLKWDLKGEMGIFVGFEQSKGLRIFYPEKRIVEIKRDVVFTQCDKRDIQGQDEEIENYEETMVSLDLTSNLQEDNEKLQSDATSEKEHVHESQEEELLENDNDRQEQRERTRSGRITTRPMWWNDYDLSMLAINDEPRSYKEAMNSKDAEKWKEAIRSELAQLQDNNTWTEVMCIPDGEEVISSKWVFKKKDNTFKARLVARGFEQNCNYEYDLYAPVARLNTFRIFVSVATKLNLQINQMDVCGAFLNAKLDEDLYLTLPSGSDIKNVKLNKSLYGLKRAPKYWNDTFNNVMLSMGYKKSEKDYCLYSKCNGNIKSFLLLYVDDILYFSNCKDENLKLKEMLCKTFKMKDLGHINKFLGIEVKQDLCKGCTTISQKDYLKKLLQTYNMLDCKPLLLPIDKNYNFHVLKRESSESKDIENKCRKLIGSLIYVAMGTRPDLCAVVNILSRYQSCASVLLYKLLLNILRYLKGSIDLCLTYFKDCNDNVVGYVDSDWGGSEDRRSTTGCCFNYLVVLLFGFLKNSSR